MTEIGIADNIDQNRIDRKEKKEGDSDEFDMFAQSRNTSYETAKNSGSKYEDNLEQVSGGSLSTAILNRNNPKYPPADCFYSRFYYCYFSEPGV